MHDPSLANSTTTTTTTTTHTHTHTHTHAHTHTHTHTHTQVDGVIVYTAVANLSRPDLVPYACPTPAHGYNVELPTATVKTLSSGNHTLAAFARLANGSRWQVVYSPSCVNLLRRSCVLPEDCRCGAPPPPRILVSNSIRCVSMGNMCDGAPCNAAANGCIPPAVNQNDDPVS
jgi:hypothetical protein